MSNKKATPKKERHSDTGSTPRRYRQYVKFKPLDHPVVELKGDYYNSNSNQNSADEFGDSPYFMSRQYGGSHNGSPSFGPSDGYTIDGGYTGPGYVSQSASSKKKKQTYKQRSMPRPPVSQLELIMRSYGFGLDPLAWSASKFENMNAVDRLLDWSTVQYVWSFHRSKLHPSSLSRNAKAPVMKTSKSTSKLGTKSKDKSPCPFSAPTLPLEDASHCPICLSSPSAAVSTKCGHVFCLPCILEHIARSSDPIAKCPLCKEDVKEDALRPYLSLSYIVTHYDHPVKMNLVFRGQNSLQGFAAEDFDELVSQSKVAVNTRKSPFDGPQCVDLYDSASLANARKHQAESKENKKNDNSSTPAQSPALSSSLPIVGEYRYSRFSFVLDVSNIYKRMRSELVAAMNDFKETFEIMQAIEEQKILQQMEEEAKKQQDVEKAIQDSLTGVWAKRAIAKLDRIKVVEPSSAAPVASAPTTTTTTTAPVIAAGDNKLSGVKLEVRKYEHALKTNKDGLHWDEDPSGIFLRIALDLVEKWMDNCAFATRKYGQQQQQQQKSQQAKKNEEGKNTKPQQSKLSLNSSEFTPSTLSKGSKTHKVMDSSYARTPEELGFQDEEAALAFALELSAREAKEEDDMRKLAALEAMEVMHETAEKDLSHKQKEKDLLEPLSLASLSVSGLDSKLTELAPEEVVEEEAKSLFLTPSGESTSRFKMSKVNNLSAEEISVFLPRVSSGVMDNLSTGNSQPPLVPSIMYYQSHSGEPLFLHPANMRALITQFKCVTALPKTLVAKVIGVERNVVTEKERKHYPYASHLPVGASFLVAFLDLDGLLSEETKAIHGDELQWLSDRIREQKLKLAKTDAELTKKRDHFIKNEFERAKRSASSDKLSREAREVREMRILLGEEGAAAFFAERSGRHFPTLPSPTGLDISLSTASSVSSSFVSGRVSESSRSPSISSPLASPIASGLVSTSIVTGPNLKNSFSESSLNRSRGSASTSTSANTSVHAIDHHPESVSPWGGSSATRLAMLRAGNANSGQKSVGFPSLGK